MGHCRYSASQCLALSKCSVTVPSEDDTDDEEEEEADLCSQGT